MAESRSEDVRSAVKLAFGDPPDLANPPDPTELLLHCIRLQGEVNDERRLADSWRHLAGHYDDIRYTLRNCEDTAEGHAEFYRECCVLIFGYYEGYEGDSRLAIGDDGDG